VAGWCVCSAMGWWVRIRSPSNFQVDCYLLSHKAMRALRRPQAEMFIGFIFAVKHKEKAIDNKLYIRCYIHNYIIRLYVTIFPIIFISHHIPPYPTIITISHHIKTGISQRHTPDRGGLPMYGHRSDQGQG